MTGQRWHQVGAWFQARSRRDTWKQICEDLVQRWVSPQLLRWVGEARTAQMEVVDMDFSEEEDEDDDDDTEDRV